MRHNTAKLLLSAIVILLPAFVSAEIGQMKVDHYCSFNNERLPSILTTFDSDNAAVEALRRVMAYTGLPPRFEIRAADVPNAAAVIRNNKRYILYNQLFMRKVRDTTQNNWAEISVLAHEIGHHLSNHTFESMGSRPKFELEADRFSGFVLKKMGASLDDATAVMARMVSQQGSITHPPRSARVAAVTNGWIDAEEKAGGNQFKREPVERQPKQATSGNKAPLHSHNGRQHSHPLPAEGLSHQHGGGPRPQAVVVPPKLVLPRIPEPKMVSIRGGSFMMGSPRNEGGLGNDEKLHRVTVKNFSIGKYEVTNEEYARCVKASGCTSPIYFDLETGEHNELEGFTSPKQPVAGISWGGAMAYAIWLSQVTGRNYRLPTEAEWEYAARAGSKTEYPWGDSIGSNRANCEGCGSQWDFKRPAPVGSFAPNRWGVYDTVGNVWEWTCSAEDRKYEGGEQQCALDYDSRDRVLRGGGVYHDPSLARSASRFSMKASFYSNQAGFRLARTP